jgi:predicted 3-demethylubiquinone-9 3-methyltransferase (glyoxalase superfamily)
MTKSVNPFVMFPKTAHAEEAMQFYASVFPDARVERLERFAAGEKGKQGTVKSGALAIAGQTIMFLDSPVVHAFDLTPAISFFVVCESAAEVRRLAAALGEGGKEFMPVDNYGFSDLFAWVGDRFDVNWQLNHKAGNST